MKFIDFLLHHCEAIRKANIPPLSSLCAHSKKVRPSSLFMAIKGQKSDGHNYIEQAVSQGASLLLVQKTDNIPSHFKGMILKYEDKDKILPQILNQFYDFPSKKLFTVGVTGTNGKTSFCYMLEHIYNFCGWPTAVMGTVDQHFKQNKWPSLLTSPDPMELFERLNDFVKLGARAVVMEASSHALDQNRLAGLDFNGLVFSNLSQDHLDYHGNMENYFQAKQKLFSMERGKNLFFLVNQDDKYGQRLKKRGLKPGYGYGQDSRAEFCFAIKSQKNLSSVFELKSSFGSQEFFLPLPGDYNVYNAVSALSCAMLTGFKAKDCAQALKSFLGAPGRLERVSPLDFPFDVFVDYAHTPSALAQALSALKAKNKKIILVFGCGGDRDKDKRPKMAETALKLADFVFLTTDNPRLEEPQQIADEALSFLSSQQREKITVELDRKTAIQKAIQSAKKGDRVLIAGKGHENYQIIKNKRIPFCDRRTALEFLNK